MRTKEQGLFWEQVDRVPSSGALGTPVVGPARQGQAEELALC